MASNLSNHGDVTRHLVELSVRLPVEDFVASTDREVARLMRNSQCRYLTCQPWEYPYDDGERLDEALEVLQSFDFVGITERFAESLILFQNRYLASRIKSFDIANVLSSRDTVISDRITAAVTTVNALDCKLYDHACRIFERQLKLVGARFGWFKKAKLPYGVVVR
jgi:hypothetical protein